MDRVIGWVSRGLGQLAALCIAFAMLATGLDVGRRAITGRAIPGVVESGELVMVGIVFLGLAVTQRENAHVSMSIVANRMSTRVASAMRLIGLLVAAVVVTWILIATGQRALASIASGEYRWGTVRLYVWPARLAIPVGLAALLLEMVLDMRRLLRSLRRGHEKPSAPTLSDQPVTPAVNSSDTVWRS